MHPYMYYDPLLLSVCHMQQHNATSLKPALFVDEAFVKASTAA